VRWPALGRVSLVTAAALASLAASWLRWINPFVDSGREMDVPARLAAGETLYRDVVFYYGPAGPWLQALVLRLWDAGRQLAGHPRWAESAPLRAATHPGATGGGALAAATHPGITGANPLGAFPAGRSWLPLELACLALAAAILFLLYRLAAAAGGPRSALAATALAAAFCLGAPHGGAFVFPYSASSLYALAGGLLALTASLRPAGWRRRLLVAGGLVLALAARAEIGAAVALILVIAALRSRSPLPEGSRSNGSATADTALGAGRPPSVAKSPAATPLPGWPGAMAFASPDTAPGAARHGTKAPNPPAPAPHGPALFTRLYPDPGAVAAIADLAVGAAGAAVIYGIAFAGTSWHVLLAEGPFTHVLAMPPEWKNLYGSVSGLARLDRSLPQLAWGLALDALVLLVCACPPGARSNATESGARRSGGMSLGVAGSADGNSAAAGTSSAAESSIATRTSSLAGNPAAAGTAARPRLLPRLAFCAATAAGIAAFCWWGGPLRWRWAGAGSDLPPVLFPLPLVAAAAALAVLRRPLDARGRARFMLFGLAAALATRVILGCKIGPAMTAYCALPLPPLLATAGVLACDLLAPRLRNPGGFRFRLAVLAAGLAGLYLFRIGVLAWGPHIVRLDTSAGSLRLPWKEANAIAGTLDYFASRARLGDRLASFPEAGFFNFVTGLPNSLRQEQIFPGVLGGGREAEAIARLLATRPRFVLLANRPTPEFGRRAFGDDYAAGLWSTVEGGYSLAATFGNAADGAPIGARRFFIRVYEPNPPLAGSASPLQRDSR
jgi:hypothetical protein